MTEDIKIVTGTPTHCEKKISEYMEKHPDGSILSSAITAESKGSTKCLFTLGRCLGPKR